MNHFYFGPSFIFRVTALGRFSPPPPLPPPPIKKLPTALDNKITQPSSERTEPPCIFSKIKKYETQNFFTLQTFFAIISWHFLQALIMCPTFVPYSGCHMNFSLRKHLELKPGDTDNGNFPKRKKKAKSCQLKFTVKVYEIYTRNSFLVKLQLSSYFFANFKWKF